LGGFNTGFGNSGSFNTGGGNGGNFNTGFWNAGNVNTGLGNTGNTNTGFFNFGDLNTGSFGGGLPFLGNPTAVNSGFNNTGVGDSGFYNVGTTVSGFDNRFFDGVFNGFSSGFLNSAGGGALVDGLISGFGNQGVTGFVPLSNLLLSNPLVSTVIFPAPLVTLLGLFGGTLPPGVVSGLISGAGNTGTLISGAFNLGPR
jgi:hypothetical protein